MNWIVKLKFLSAFLLACCLFLPLSQCTRLTAPKQGVPQHQVVIKIYTFSSTSKLDAWLHSLAFLLPFVTLVLSAKGKYKIASSLVVLILSVGALYTVFRATFFGEILIGGYLAYFSSVSLIAILLFELASAIRRSFQGRRINSSASQP